VVAIHDFAHSYAERKFERSLSRKWTQLRLKQTQSVKEISSMARLNKIIDVHSHPILDFGERAPVGKGHKQPDWSVESALSYMEEYDISACVLSSPAAANDATGQEARDIARRTNEVLAEIVAKRYETALEFTYGFRFRGGALILQPDLQYIIRPGGTGQISNAFVAGFRTGINF
jgi:hypothetical protein